MGNFNFGLAFVACVVGLGGGLLSLSPVPASGVDLTGVGFVHEASSTYPGYSPYSVSDDVAGLPNAWHTQDLRQGAGFPHWISIDFGTLPPVVTDLKILAYEDGAGVRLRHFIFEGSHDGVSFVPLHPDTLEYAPVPQFQSFTFANAIAFRYYRLVGLDNWTAFELTVTQMVIEEWEMESNLSGTPGGGDPPTARLLGNHPNPFNPTTTIVFELAQHGPVSLVILGPDGRKVRTLATGLSFGPGRHAVTWDGTDDQGRPVGSGLFLSRLAAGGKVETGKLVIVR